MYRSQTFKTIKNLTYPAFIVAIASIPINQLITTINAVHKAFNTGIVCCA